MSFFIKEYECQWCWDYAKELSFGEKIIEENGENKLICKNCFDNITPEDLELNNIVIL